MSLYDGCCELLNSSVASEYRYDSFKFQSRLTPERIASKFFRIKIDLWPFTFFHDYYDPAKEWMSHLTENGLALEQTQIQT